MQQTVTVDADVVQADSSAVALHVFGSLFCSSAVAVVAMADAVREVEIVAVDQTTTVSGSSFFCSAAVTHSAADVAVSFLQKRCSKPAASFFDI